MLTFRRYAVLLVIMFIKGVAPATAQTYPTKPIRLIVGQSAGGGTDILARLYAKHLSSMLGQQVFVDNRPGAGGTIGAAIAAKAEPDGHTLFMASVPHAIAPSIYKHLPYNLVEAFSPISLVARQQLCLVVHPSLPVTSVKQLVSYLKARPGTVSYASAGYSSTNYVAAALFEKVAGVKMINVAYKGTGPSITDQLAGRIPVTFGNLLPMLPFIKAGSLRPLAVTGAARSPVLPDVPTLAESGYPHYEAVNWYAIVAPAGTPHAIIQKLDRDIVSIAELPEVKEQIATLGGEAASSTPEETASFIASEVKKWAVVVKESGAHLD